MRWPWRLTVPAFAAELIIDVVPSPTVEEYEGTDYTVSDFHEGFARVWLHDGRGTALIDETYKVVVPPEYETIWKFSEGLAGVKKNGKWGFIDTTGKLVVPCRYMTADAFSEGFAAVQAYDEEHVMWGFIDKTGKEVVPPTTYTENGTEYGYFCRGSVFHDGAARVGRISINGGKNPPVVYLVLTVDAKVSGWARKQVDSAAVKGLMPDSWGDDFTVNITRAEFAALAVKLYEAMSGEAAPAPGASPFSDSSDTAVIQAEALGIVGGVGGDRFAPDDLVTREEAATMLSRVYTRLGGAIPEVGATTFADNDSVSAWARDAVAFMSDKEIVGGVGDNKFDPQGNASIEQAMVIALRMFQNLK